MYMLQILSVVFLSVFLNSTLVQAEANQSADTQSADAQIETTQATEVQATEAEAQDTKAQAEETQITNVPKAEAIASQAQDTQATETKKNYLDTLTAKKVIDLARAQRLKKVGDYTYYRDLTFSDMLEDNCIYKGDALACLTQAYELQQDLINAFKFKTVGPWGWPVNTSPLEKTLAPDRVEPELRLNDHSYKIRIALSRAAQLKQGLPSIFSEHWLKKLDPAYEKTVAPRIRDAASHNFRRAKAIETARYLKFQTDHNIITPSEAAQDFRNDMNKYSIYSNWAQVEVAINHIQFGHLNEAEKILSPMCQSALNAAGKSEQNFEARDTRFEPCIFLAETYVRQKDFVAAVATSLATCQYDQAWACRYAYRTAQTAVTEVGSTDMVYQRRPDNRLVPCNPDTTAMMRFLESPDSTVPASPTSTGPAEMLCSAGSQKLVTDQPANNSLFRELAKKKNKIVLARRACRLDNADACYDLASYLAPRNMCDQGDCLQRDQRLWARTVRGLQFWRYFTGSKKSEPTYIVQTDIEFGDIVTDDSNTQNIELLGQAEGDEVDDATDARFLNMVTISETERMDEAAAQGLPAEFIIAFDKACRLDPGDTKACKYSQWLESYTQRNGRFFQYEKSLPSTGN